MTPQPDSSDERPATHDGLASIAIMILAAILVGVVINHFV